MPTESVSPLPKTWEIPSKLRDRLSDRAGRQRALFEDGHLLLVLHYPPKPDEVERRGRYFWRKPDGGWTCHDGAAGPASLSQHLDEYSHAVRHFDMQEEDAADASAYFKVVGGLTPLLRAATHLHQVLQDARKLVPEDRVLIRVRDQAYELERTVELLHANAKNGLEFEIAKQGESEARSSRQMARSAHRLNVLAAFFFPLATISGVLGIDGDVPWRADAQLILAVLGGGLVAGALLAWGITREPKRSGHGADRVG